MGGIYWFYNDVFLFYVCVKFKISFSFEERNWKNRKICLGISKHAKSPKYTKICKINISDINLWISILLCYVLLYSIWIYNCIKSQTQIITN